MFASAQGGDSACGAEGCGIAPWAMNIKSALRDWLSMSYGKISITMISHLRWLSPLWCLTAPPSRPAERWDNKDPQSNPFISRTTISTGYSATVEVLHRTSKWGEVRRLACPLRRFPFAAPPNTVEVLHRTSKWGEVRRLACPLRRFPFAAPPNCGVASERNLQGAARQPKIS